CGLEAEGHLTTARDIALMTAELIKHESIFDYTTIWMDTVRDGAFGLTNTNKMIRTFNGMKGLKTGYTSEAGYCLSGVAERDGMMLIAVVLKGQTSKSRNSDVAALLEYGFANYAQVELTADQPLMPVPVKLGKAGFVPVKIERADLKLIEKTELAEVRKEVSLCEKIDAPVNEGDVLGSFTVYSGDKVIYKADIMAAEAVSKLTVIDIWKMLFARVAMREN
ncbi:MAG: D-alanyl-D-alanine carboxypeptidase, partial [Clostridia bacterium]|nr:D-alanyl-D-alanine carboxypeptidase [Clostridia bacterium]